jgi:hypothetical protein
MPALASTQARPAIAAQHTAFASDAIDIARRGSAFDQEGASAFQGARPPLPLHSGLIKGSDCGHIPVLAGKLA